MKYIFTLFLILTSAFINTIQSQPWYYNLGTGSGTLSTGSSTSFFPAPPSGSTWARIGSGNGSINIENQVIQFGTDSYIRGSAATGGSVNKFSVNNYTSAKAFTLRFNLRLGSADGNANATSGNWYLFCGDGNMYSDANTFSGAQVFTGLRFRAAGGAIFISFRNRNAWDSLTVNRTLFNQAQNYLIEIYGNNTTSLKTYTYGTTQSLDSNKWDLWVDGTLVGDDLPKAQLPNDAIIDSWVLYGESSVLNNFNIFTDEFYYNNDVSGSPLPVNLSSFIMTGESRNVKLSWSTLNEINNAGFRLERRNENTASPEWNEIAYIRGNGTTNLPQNYYYEDKSLSSGKYSYRLKQTDYNGNYEYFTPTNIGFIEISKPKNFTIRQNYPNPSNPVTKIDYDVPFDSYVNITVYDITGRTVKELVNSFKSADFYSVTFNGSDLSSGIYFYRITAKNDNETFSKTLKMLLLK